VKISRRKLLIGTAAFVAAGSLGYLDGVRGLLGSLVGEAAAQPSALMAPSPLGDIVQGSETAPVTIIEYASLTCPHCREFALETLPKLKEQYIDTGKVKLIQRDFPLNKPAVQAAQLAHCAGPMRYSALVDVLFKTQDQWLNEQAVEKLAKIAATAGMDRPTFDACLANKDIEAKIVASRKAGEDAFQVNATPTFIVNGVKLEGEQTVDDLKALFAKLAPSGS